MKINGNAWFKRNLQLPSSTVNSGAVPLPQAAGGQATTTSKDQAATKPEDVEENRAKKIINKLLFYGFILTIVITANKGNPPWLQQVLDLILTASWSGPLVHFIKEETQGFIILFLVSLYLDIFRDDSGEILKLLRTRVRGIEERLLVLQAEALTIKSLLDKEYWTRVNPSNAVERILKSQYGEDSNIGNLLSTILPEKPSYNNVFVDIILCDTPNESDFYQSKFELRFTASIKEFVVAFVTEAVLQDKLSAACHSLNDIFTFSDSQSMEKGLEEVLKGKNPLRIITTSPKGITSGHTIPFQIVPPDSYHKYLGDDFSIDTDKLRLLVCQLPDNFTEIISELSFELRKNDYFYYWVADRPMFIRQIKIDATRFSLADGERFTFQPFLANSYIGSETITQSGAFSVNVNNWIVKGQGISLSWGDYAKNRKTGTKSRR